MNSYKVLFLSAVLFFSILLSACDDDDDDEGPGFFRFYNAISDGPEIELELDEDFYSRVEFRESTSLDELPADNYEAVVHYILPNSDIENVIPEENLRIRENVVFTYLLAGTADDPESLIIETDVADFEDEDFDEDLARLRFVHTAPDLSAAVDIYLLDAGDDLLNQTADFTLDYLDVSSPIDVRSGDYRIMVTTAGSDTVIFDSDDIDVNIEDVMLYSLVSNRTAADSEPRLTMVELDDGRPRTMPNETEDTHFRFNNAIADVAAVDVYLGDIDTAPIIANLGFQAISDEIKIAPDDYEINITIAATDEIIQDLDIEAESDAQVIVLFAGDYNAGLDNEVKRNLISEKLRVISTHAVVNFAHGAGFAEDEGLDVIIVEEGGDPDSVNAILNNVSYLAGGSFELEEGRYDLYLYYDDGNARVLGPRSFDPDAGDVVNITATNADGGDGPMAVKIITRGL